MVRSSIVKINVSLGTSFEELSIDELLTNELKLLLVDELVCSLELEFPLQEIKKVPTTKKSDASNILFILFIIFPPEVLFIFK